MNIKELKELIKNLPDDMKVVIDYKDEFGQIDDFGKVKLADVGKFEEGKSGTYYSDTFFKVDKECEEPTIKAFFLSKYDDI